MSIATLPRRPDPIDFSVIKREHPLVAIAGGVVKLQRAGKEWKACCPFHADTSPSFTIYGRGHRFQCFGCGAGGDVLDFLCRLHGVGVRDAVAMLSGGEVPSTHFAPLPAPSADDAGRSDEARAIWEAAQPIRGTLAEHYLRSRALHLLLPDTLRFAVLRYGGRGAEYPVMVAAVSDVDGDLIGIQRTYLSAAGDGKAAVPKPKLSLGRVSGGAVRLAPASREVVITEGIEDALTLQQELGQAVWAAAGATMMPSIKFPSWVRSVAIGGGGRREWARSSHESSACLRLATSANEGLLPRGR